MELIKMKQEKEKPKLAEAKPEKIEEKPAAEAPKEEVKKVGEPAKSADKNGWQESTNLDLWKPKTELGKKVKAGEIKDICQVLSAGKKIMEKEIVEALLPELESDFLLIGQAKGKFGGGKRRMFKQTQKKSREGNKPHFSCMAVVGNRNGYVGVGLGSSKDTLPSREKSVRNAKLNIIQISRGCGSWACGCKEPHSIPFEVSGRCGSVRIRLIPAPKGAGLCVENELQKVMRLAGIKDVWSKSSGQTRKKGNMITACMKALEKTVKTRLKNEQAKDIKFGA